MRYMMRSGILGNAMVTLSLALAPGGLASAQAPAAQATGTQQVASPDGSERTTYRIAKVSTYLTPDRFLFILSGLKLDARVVVGVVGAGNSSLTLSVQGPESLLDPTITAIKDRLALPEVREQEHIDEFTFLPRIKQGSDWSVKEALNVIVELRALGVEVLMVDRSVPNNRREDASLGLQISGERKKVEASLARLNEIVQDRERWLEAERREIEKSTVTIEFPGGTVEEFVQAVIGKFNFVPPLYQDDSFRKLAMRPVKTRRVDVQSALELLTRFPPLDENGSPVALKASFSESAPAKSPLSGVELNERLARSLLVIDRAGLSAAEPAAARRAALSLGEESPKRELLDATLDALSVAINLDGPSKTFRAKFHAPSNILIVQGTPDELAVAGQIVKARFPKAKIELPAEPKS